MSTITNSTNRVAGLISGLETEELVKAMTANTKMKINSQKQKIQTLQWKQEAYRSVISKITDFQNKYLDLLSPTSLKAKAVMSKFKAVVSNDKYITASASSNATPAKYTISKTTAAKGAVITSKDSVAAGEIKLDLSKAQHGKSYSVEVELDGSKKTVTFRGGEDTEASKQNFLNALNDTFSGVAGKNGKFAFRAGTSNLYFKNTDSEGNSDGITHTFSVGYNSEGVGLSNTAYSRISTSNTLGEAGFATALRSTTGTYDITINGVNFHLDKQTTISDFINAVNNSSAGVKLSFSNISQTFTLETKETGADAEIKLSQTNGNLLNAMFGLSSEDAKPVDADYTIFTAVRYKDEQTGDIGTDLANKLKNGFEEGDGIYKVRYTDKNGKSYDVEIDLYSVGLYKDGAPYDDDQISMAFSQAFEEALIRAGVDADDIPKNVFSYSSSADGNGDLVGSLTMKAGGCGIDFRVYNDDGSVDEQEGFGLLNNRELTNAPSNYVVSTADKMEFKATDKDGNSYNVVLEKDAETDEIVITKDGKEIYRAEDTEGGFTLEHFVESGLFTSPSDGALFAAVDIEAVDEGAKNFLKEGFSNAAGVNPDEDEYKLTSFKEGKIDTVYGSNSTITISNDDGKTFTTYTSTSNSFTFDGTTITIDKDFDAEGVEDDYIIVDVSKDTSGIKDIIKGFIEDYNKILDDLYGEISTKRPKSSGSYYDPLTEEQEEEMTDKQIEDWNENAKTGLLYQDSYVQKFLSQIRSAMNTRVDGFGLGDMGIRLTEDWNDHGKLEIKDESKLDAAIEALGDKVTNLFTGVNGLAAKLEEVCDRAVSTKAKNYGYMSAVAGIEGTKTDTDNQIYKQIDYINKLLERLNTKYENEQERYWRKYSRLEQIMQNAQTQMSYFADFYSGGY